MARWVGVGTQQQRAGVEPTTLRSQIRHHTTRPPCIYTLYLLTYWHTRCSLCTACMFVPRCHYPGTLTTNASLETKKRLWSSEDYSTFNDDVGAGCWARVCLAWISILFRKCWVSGVRWPRFSLTKGDIYCLLCIAGCRCCKIRLIIF